MNKFKKILLGALSALTLGLFVAFGTEVDAANADVTLGPHTWYADTNWKISSKSYATADGNVETVGIFKGVGENTLKSYGTTAGGTSSLTNSYTTKSEDWASHGELVTSGNSRPLKVTIGDSQVASFDLYVYTSKEANKRSVLINGNEEKISVAKNTVQKISGNLVGGENTIYSSSDAVCFLEMDVTVSANTKAVTGISVTNSQTYNLGDAFDASKLTVTATYDDNTTGPLSSDKYTVSITDNVTTFSAAGTYTVTVTYNDNTSINDTCDITIANAFFYEFYSANTSASNTTVTVVADKIVLKNSTAKSDSSRKNTFEGNTITSYQQANTLDFVLDAKAEVSFYITQTGTTTNVHDRTYYIKNSSGNIITGSGYTPVMKPANNATVSTFQKIILPAGSYELLSPCGTLNMWGMKINYDATGDAIDTTKTVNFQYQFSTDNNKLRFIGTLNDIEDLSKLDDVKVTMVLKKSSSQNADTSFAGTIEITTVYTKVMNGSDTLKDANTNTYYAVCVMSGLDSLRTSCTAKVDTGWIIEAKLQYTYNSITYVISASGNITIVSA